MISGAYGYNSNTGRAYVYTNTMKGTDIPDLTMTGEDSLSYFGFSVSTAGDVNRDGFSDVIVGIGGGFQNSHRKSLYFFWRRFYG